MSDEYRHRGDLFELLRLIASSIALAFAAIYGSGFLCVFTFLNRFGVRDFGGDFWRARYLHVGILVLLLPFCVILPMILAFSIRAATTGTFTTNLSQDEKELPNPLFASRIFGYVNVGVCFYLYFITQSISGLADLTLFPILVIISVAIPYICELVLAYCRLSTQSERIIRWLCVLTIILLFDFFAFYGHIDELVDWLVGTSPFSNGSVFYMVFVFFVPFWLWRAHRRAQRALTKRDKAKWYLLGASTSFIFYYLSLISFSTSVYPFIPVAKGGGNFERAPRIEVVFKLPYESSIDPTIQRLAKAGTFIIIDQTSTSLFFADAGKDEPLKWKHMESLPQVIEVNRDAIEMITYRSPQGDK